MKRITALLLSLIMVLSLCACGGESTDSDTNASKDGSVYKLGDTIETDLFKITRLLPAMLKDFPTNRTKII